MTIYRLKTDPASGDVAIYSVPSHASTDNGPLADPWAEPQRLQFHTDVIMPSTTPALTQQVAITIPSQSANTKFSGQINLFAHGKGEPCMVEGRVLDLNGSGNHVGINGTMPVFEDGTGRGFVTWLALAANNTHVVAVYFGICSGARASLNLTVEASAYDYLASGPADNSNPSLPLMKYVPGSYFQMGRGKVDTRRRNIRRVTAGGNFQLAISPTLSIVGSGKTTTPSYVQNEKGWRWRYSCGGYVIQTTVGWDGSSVSAGSANAETIQVKL